MNRKVILKVIIGIPTALFPIYMTYSEGIKNKQQLTSIFFISLYSFFIGWGIEEVKFIRYNEFRRIPFWGIQLYLLFKIVIGYLIGGYIVIYKMIKFSLVKLKEQRRITNGREKNY